MQTNFYIKKITLLILLLLFTVIINANAQCTGCTSSIAGSSNSINIGNNEIVCITSGEQTGGINFNGNGQLCVATGASVSINGINNFGAQNVINVNGDVTFNSSITLNGGTFNVCAGATLSFSTNPNSNGAVTYNICSTGILSFITSYTLSNGSVINNDGLITAAQDFSTNTGTTFFNNGRLRTSANFNPAGNFTNNGLITALGFININPGISGEKPVNNCRFVSVQGFNNNNSGMENNGLIWVPGNVDDGALLQINQALLNNGFIRSPRFFNLSTITQTALGQIRVEGSTNPSINASVNNGIISGGTVSDSTNVSATPAYSFDAGNNNITSTYAALDPVDTNSSQYANSCVYLSLPLNFISIHGYLLDHSKARIYWITADEENVSRIEVLYSTEGKDYNVLDRMDAKGAIWNSYSSLVTIDTKSETHYFKIKSTDIDGKSMVSETISLRTNSNSNEFQIFPNPSSNGNYTIVAPNNNLLRLNVYSVTGRLLYKSLFNEQTIISLSEQPKGLYLFNIQDESGVLLNSSICVKGN